MAKSNFVVHNGLEVGNLTVWAANGDVTTTGNITVTTGQINLANTAVSSLYTTSGIYWTGNGAAWTSSGGGGSGTPGGSTTQVQFNDAGSFLGSSSFTFNKNTNVLTVAGNVLAGNLTVTSAGGQVQGYHTGAIGANVANTGVFTSLNTTTFTATSTVNLGSNANVTITGGSSGNFLRTDGSGGLSWATPSAGVGTPGGSNTYIQFNDAGSFGGVASFAINKITGNVTVGNIAATGVGSQIVGYFNGAIGANAANTGAFTTVTTTSTITAQGTIAAPTVNAATIGNSGALITGTLQTASQTNITAVGTLTSLAVSGNVTVGNISTTSMGGQHIGYHTGAIGANAANTGAFTTLTTTSTITSQGTVAAPTVNAATIGNSGALITGTLQTASQTNITTVGTLASLTVSGATSLGAVSNITITGGTNGYFLQTNGSGTLTWAAASSSTSPGGSNTYVQFNDGGSFGGASGLTYNKGSNLFAVAGSLAVGKTSASYRVDVQSSSTGNDGIYYYNSGTSGTPQAVVAVNTNGATGMSMGQAYSTKNAFLYLADNAQMEFSTNATSRMTISSTGNVAIGTNSGIRAPLVITPVTYSANPVMPNKIRIFDDGGYSVYGFGVSSGYMDAVYGQGGIKFSNVNASTGALSTFATMTTNQLILNGYDAVTTLLVSGQSKGVRIQPTSTATIIEGVDNTGVSSYQPLYLGGSTLTFTVSNNVKMHINADGNVGIGLTNSPQPLSIQNSTQYKGFALYNGTYGPGTQGVAYITGTTATNDAGQLVLSYGGVQKVNIKAVTSGTDVAIAVTGGITATGNITAYYSDDRLKTKLGNIDNALEKVNKLNGFNYQPNDLAQKLGYALKDEVGVSAQEVQKVLPSAVVTAPIDENYLTVHYDRLIPLLIEAIKELSDKVDRLEGKIK